MLFFVFAASREKKRGESKFFTKILGINDMEKYTFDKISYKIYHSLKINNIVKKYGT